MVPRCPVSTLRYLHTFIQVRLGGSSSNSQKVTPAASQHFLLPVTAAECWASPHPRGHGSLQQPSPAAHGWVCLLRLKGSNQSSNFSRFLLHYKQGREPPLHRHTLEKVPADTGGLGPQGSASPSSDPGQRRVPHADRPFCNPGHQMSTAKSRGGEPGARLSRDTRLRDPLSQPLPPAGPGPPSTPHITPSPPSSPAARAPWKNQPCVPAPHAGRHHHPSWACSAHICVSQPTSSLPPHRCTSEPGKHWTNAGQGSGRTPTGVSHLGSAGGEELVTSGAAPPTA